MTHAPIDGRDWCIEAGDHHWKFGHSHHAPCCRHAGHDPAVTPPTTDTEPLRNLLVPPERVAQALKTLPRPGALDEAIVTAVAEAYADGRLALAAERASGGLDGPTDQCQVCEGWGAYCDKHRGAAAERATGGQDDE